MGDTTKIEWADHTFNPWSGCSKVSAGCAHCYAAALPPKMRRGAEWGEGRERVLAGEAYWRQPLAWARKAAAEGVRRRVFCASVADVFEDRPDLDPWRIRLWGLIDRTPHLDWLLLTKRPARMASWAAEHGWPVNAWAGVSVESQAAADERIPDLIRVPAPVRFLSCEPLLGPIHLDLRARWFGGGCRGGCLEADLYDSTDGAERCRRCQHPQAGGVRAPVDWIIVGGESGRHARPMHPDWARSLRNRAAAAGVAFLFKQWGEWAPVDDIEANGTDWPGMTNPDRADGGVREHFWRDSWVRQRSPVELHGRVGGDTSVLRVGKKAAGRLLDGVEHIDFPVPR
jgi:protein gp37